MEVSDDTDAMDMRIDDGDDTARSSFSIFSIQGLHGEYELFARVLAYALYKDGLSFACCGMVSKYWRDTVSSLPSESIDPNRTDLVGWWRSANAFRRHLVAKRTGCGISFCTSAARRGRFDTMMHGHTDWGYKVKADTFVQMAAQGYVDGFRYLRTEYNAVLAKQNRYKINTCENDVAKSAVKHGQKDVLEYLRANGRISCDSAAYTAAKYGHSDLCVWLSGSFPNANWTYRQNKFARLRAQVLCTSDAKLSRWLTNIVALHPIDFMFHQSIAFKKAEFFTTAVLHIKYGTFDAVQRARFQDAILKTTALGSIPNRFREIMLNAALHADDFETLRWMIREGFKFRTTHVITHEYGIYASSPSRDPFAMLRLLNALYEDTEDHDLWVYAIEQEDETCAMLCWLESMGRLFDPFANELERLIHKFDIEAIRAILKWYIVRFDERQKSFSTAKGCGLFESAVRHGRLDIVRLLYCEFGCRETIPGYVGRNRDAETILWSLDVRYPRLHKDAVKTAVVKKDRATLLALSQIKQLDKQRVLYLAMKKTNSKDFWNWLVDNGYKLTMEEFIQTTREPNTDRFRWIYERLFPSMERSD
jgi:hypothetical protein